MPWNEADRVKYEVIRERYSSKRDLTTAYRFAYGVG